MELAASMVDVFPTALGPTGILVSRFLAARGISKPNAQQVQGAAGFHLVL